MKPSSEKVNEASLEKPTGRFSLAQPWAVGAAGAGLLLLGLGAWSLQRSQVENRSLHPLSASWHQRGGHPVYEPIRRQADETEGISDNLEDVLSKLEGEAMMASAAPRKALATSGSRTQKKQKKQQDKQIKKKELLAELEAKAKAEEPTEEDKEKARAIIRDTLKKLDPEGGKGDAKTRKTVDKLKALLGDAPVPDAPEAVADAPEAENGAGEEDGSHFDFAKALQAEHDRKPHVDLKTVRAEFKRDFAADSRTLMCSGCKLVAARLTSELDEHDVHEQESPAQMVAAKRRAIDSTCSSLRHLQAVVDESGQARFEASEVTGEGEREGKRLCAAILEESRFDLLARLIQRKVPEMSHMYAPTRAKHENWERWLCAERTRLCKRSEVRDEEDEEEQDL